VTSHSVGRRQSRFSRKKSDVPNKANNNNNRNISGKTSQRSNTNNEQSFKKKTMINSQMGSKERSNNYETKSQMSTTTGKSKNNRCDTKDSHRTEATSTKQNLAKSSYSGVKFEDEEQSNNYRNLDLKLSENVDEIMLQRKQRFEQL